MRRSVEPADDTSPGLPSIYEHVRRHICPDGPGLMEGGDELPDEEDIREQQRGLRWAAGALDGVMAHHTSGKPEEWERRVTELHRALIRLAERPGPQTRARVRMLFRTEEVRRLVDPLLMRLITHPPRRQDRFYEEMKRLFLESGYRNEVKFAMAILACFCGQEDADLFRTIGRHAEFTEYAAVALARVLDDPVPEWMEQARVLTGWGKVNLVERLLQNPRPEVCEFLLRHGCQRDVLDSYVALEIATTCRLHEVLAADTVDPELLAGAARIIQVLAGDATDGGPGGDMTSYPHGALATERFLTHFRHAARSLDDYLVADAVRRLAAGECHGWRPQESQERAEERLRGYGWDAARRTQILDLCHQILQRPEWPARVGAALSSSDQHERWRGSAVAARLGLPLYDLLAPILETDPLDGALWSQLASAADETTIDAVVALALRLFSADAIASGEADHPGPGPWSGHHFCVTLVLQELQRFPGKGWEIIRRSLRSPYAGNRARALHALADWPRMALTPEIIEAVSPYLDDEDEHVRAACAKVLEEREQEEAEP